MNKIPEQSTHPNEDEKNGTTVDTVLAENLNESNHKEVREKIMKLIWICKELTRSIRKDESRKEILDKLCSEHGFEFIIKENENEKEMPYYKCSISVNIGSNCITNKIFEIGMFESTHNGNSNKKYDIDCKVSYNTPQNISLLDDKSFLEYVEGWLINAIDTIIIILGLLEDLDYRKTWISNKPRKRKTNPITSKKKKKHKPNH